MKKTFALPLDKKKFMPLPLCRVKHQTPRPMSTYILVAFLTLPAWGTMLWAFILDINNH